MSIATELAKLQTARNKIRTRLVALGLAVVGVASLLWLSTLVAAILGGIAVLTGFASLMVGKSGTLPAIVAAVAGFLTVLSAIISMKMQ